MYTEQGLRRSIGKNPTWEKVTAILELNLVA
ncbi:hypothetical protein ES703_36590 [subsurface metagenome]